MVDLGPERKRIAQLFRMLGSTGGERRNAFAALERVMQGAGVGWTDIGDAIESKRDEDKYSEHEMQEYAQAARAEGVEVGIKIGQARRNGTGSSTGTLPPPAIMAEYCHGRLTLLKSDWQRDFVNDLFLITRRRGALTRARLANLAKIYIEIGGKI
jgi:hypothetical protein